MKNSLFIRFGTILRWSCWHRLTEMLPDSLSFFLSLSFSLFLSLSRRVWIHLFSLSIACRDVCFRHSLIYDLSRYSNQEKERKFFCLIHSKMLISQLNWGQIWFGNVNVFIKIVQRVLKPFLFCIAF